jgi:hypothetical protein
MRNQLESGRIVRPGRIGRQDFVARFVARAANEFVPRWYMQRQLSARRLTLRAAAT